MKFNVLNVKLNQYFKLIMVIGVTLSSVACVTEVKTQSKALEADDDTKANSYSELAASYIDIGKYKVAKQELAKAFSVDPNHSNANYVAAVLSLKLGEKKEAEGYFRTAVKDEKNAIAAHELGVFLCRSGRVKESMLYFTRAIQNPLFKNPAISNLRAGECISRTDPQKAQSYFKAALQADLSLNVAMYRLAEVLYIQDEPLSARAYLERYQAIAGVSAQSLLLGYRIESKANSTKAADNYAAQLLQKYPGSTQAKKLRKIMGLRG